MKIHKCEVLRFEMTESRYEI